MLAYEGTMVLRRDVGSDAMVPSSLLSPDLCRNPPLSRLQGFGAFLPCLHDMMANIYLYTLASMETTYRRKLDSAYIHHWSNTTPDTPPSYVSG